MSDWRTLHLFDKTEYIEKIIPKIKDLDNYLNDFLNDRRKLWFKFRSEPELIITNTKKFILELDDTLSLIKNKDNNNESYLRERAEEIDFLNFLIQESIFEKAGFFNPHFKLGGRIFESCIENFYNIQIKRDLLYKIRDSEINGILNINGDGIINWFSNEEIKYLYLSKNEIKPSDKNSADYVKEFKIFLKIAYERNLGFISIKNPCEGNLKLIKNRPNELIEFVEKNKFNNIIIH